MTRISNALGWWLDCYIFGNGHGMAPPFSSSPFYWLIDASDRRRKGRFYKWVGGLGAQLRSFEWRMPAPGTERRLNGRRYRVFQASRRILRCDVSWSLVGFPKDLNTANALTRQIHDELKWCHNDHADYRPDQS